MKQENKKMCATVNIVRVNQQNFELILPLISEYQYFYGVEPDVEKNRQFFRRFIEDCNLGVQFLALDPDGNAIGFATVYQFFSSTRATSVAVMNDLYVKEQRRGAGCGRALIAQSAEYSRQLGLPALQWTTAVENVVAQKLYDGMPTAKKSNWYHYRLPV